jgi:hypothetical protein
MQLHLREAGQRHPRHAVALAVQPRVRRFDPARRAGQDRRVRPAAVVVDRAGTEDDVVRKETELLLRLAQRTLFG